MMHAARMSARSLGWISHYCIILPHGRIERPDMHSLRSGGTDTLALSNYSHTETQKIGCWNGTTCKEHILHGDDYEYETKLKSCQCLCDCLSWCHNHMHRKRVHRHLRDCRMKMTRCIRWCIYTQLEWWRHQSPVQNGIHHIRYTTDTGCRESDTNHTPLLAPYWVNIQWKANTTTLIRKCNSSSKMPHCSKQTHHGILYASLRMHPSPYSCLLTAQC
jgi:hypothetical protein